MMALKHSHILDVAHDDRFITSNSRFNVGRAEWVGRLKALPGSYLACNIVTLALDTIATYNGLNALVSTATLLYEIFILYYLFFLGFVISLLFQSGRIMSLKSTLSPHITLTERQVTQFKFGNGRLLDILLFLLFLLLFLDKLKSRFSHSQAIIWAGALKLKVVQSILCIDYLVRVNRRMRVSFRVLLNKEALMMVRVYYHYWWRETLVVEALQCCCLFCCKVLLIVND